jgi:hypothetical protein
MSAEQVGFIPRCAECLEVWLSDGEERWRAYLDTDDELVFYCKECAEREFGEWRWRE